MYGPNLPQTGILAFGLMASLCSKIFIPFFILILALIIFGHLRLRYHEYKMRKKDVL